MTGHVKGQRGSSYQVLLYHGVYDDATGLGGRNSSGKHIPASRFETEMRVLHEMRPVVSMAEIQAAHWGETTLPDGAVAVTFDDGYLNNYETAWPILERHRIPATIYLSTGYIGTGAMMWTDRLEAAILAADRAEVNVETRDRTRDYKLDGMTARLEALKAIKALCKRLPNHVKDRVVDSVCEQLGVGEFLDHPLYRFMDWNQAREMNASALIEFGAHTENHVSLVKVPEDVMRTEISRSIETVGEELGGTCRYFAYPEGQAGDFDENVISFLKSLDLDHAPTAIEGINWTGETDPFYIHRDMVGFEDRPFPIARASVAGQAARASSDGPDSFTLFGRDLASEVGVIAEIGVNHEGDLKAAEALTEAAAGAGADAVKFQSYTPERFSTTDDAERFARISRFGLSKDDHRRLAEVAKSCGIHFFSSAISEDWVPLIAELGSAIKIASGDLNFEPVIRLAARTGRPVVLSTGGGTAEEVARAVDWVQEEVAAEGVPQRLVIMHCVSSYPTPIEMANLLSIPFLREQFGVPVGWSNHVIEPEACLAAVALGATTVEIHVTDRREGRDFRDHELSFEPDQLAELVAGLRRVRSSLGTYGKVPQQSELEVLPLIRKGIVAARDLPAGTALSRDDLMFARPASEFSWHDIDLVVGRMLTAPVSVGGLIRKHNLA